MFIESMHNSTIVACQEVDTLVRLRMLVAIMIKNIREGREKFTNRILVTIGDDVYQWDTHNAWVKLGNID